jgi:hypothetical protein
MLLLGSVVVSDFIHSGPYIMHSHRCNAYGIFNFCSGSHRFFMLCLVYVFYIVLVLVSGDMDHFCLLGPCE